MASVAVERSGPFIGALIAALPTAAGAAYIIFAIEHPPAFIGESAVGSLSANAAVAVFVLAYAILAQRHGIALSLSVATSVWLVAAAALRLIDWTAPRAVLLNVLVYAITIPASARFRRFVFRRESIKRRRYDLASRALTAAVLVAIVTTASHWIGSFASGIFAVFPIVMGSFVAILHPRVGGPAAASVLAHAQVPLLGLGMGFLTVHYLATPLGSWWSLAAGLGMCLAWNALLWAHKRAQARSL